MKKPKKTCVSCLDRVRDHADRFPQVSSDIWFLLTVYLKRYPTVSQLRLANISNFLNESLFTELNFCGCQHSVDLRIVVDQMIMDVSHTSISSSATGIQNFVRGLMTTFRSFDLQMLFVRYDRLGYTEISRHIDVSSTTLSELVRKGIRPSFASAIKPFIPLRLQQTIKSWLYFRELQRTLIIPINCSLLLPESILDEIQVDNLVAFSSTTNKIVMFLHDAFPVTHPQLVNPETKIRSSSVISLLQASDLISCQTEAVAQVAQNLLSASYALETKTNMPLVTVHRRPVLYSKSENLTHREVPPLLLPSVLALGTIEPRKDYTLLLMACEILWKRGLKFSLKIVGAWGWRTEEVSFLVAKLIKKGRPISVLSNLGDAEVADLLSVCSVFVYPSLAEGLGLPPGEALQFGLKPICRDLPTLVETFGENELTFFDGSPDDLADKIQIELASKSVVSRTIDVKQNSWQETASLIISDIQRISE